MWTRLIERCYWWWMLRTSRRSSCGALPFIYVSARDDRPASDICSTLHEAMARIAEAKGGFGELVTGHLRFVAALDAPEPSVVLHAHGYVSPFPGPEATNAHFLACRIIWAATYVRLSRDAMAHDTTKDSASIRSAAYEAQLRFTGQFPDAAEWLDYLKRHPAGI